MKYIGMDAHSGSCFFVVLGKRGRVMERQRMKTQEDLLLSFVRSVRGPKKLSFEEGVMSQWLYLLLKDEVDELIVCQPPKSTGAKTDRIDAHNIADDLRCDRLKHVFHTDDLLINLRVLTSGYNDLIQSIVSAKNRYKALYRQVAVPTGGNDFYKSEEMLSKLQIHEHHYVACTLLEQIQILEEQRKGFVERFEANVKEQKGIKLLTSIPGIGTIRANQIVAMVVTPYRFSNKSNFFSYSMLIKHNKESDGKIYGKRPAKGQSRLKEIFKTAVFSALKSNNAFRRKYDAMRKAGKDDRAARNAVAKMIAATVLGVWKSGKKYSDKKWEVTQRQNQNCHSGT